MNDKLVATADDLQSIKTHTFFSPEGILNDKIIVTTYTLWWNNTDEKKSLKFKVNYLIMKKLMVHKLRKKNSYLKKINSVSNKKARAGFEHDDHKPDTLYHLGYEVSYMLPSIKSFS